MKKIILLFILFVVMITFPCYGANYYIAQTAAGSDDGSSCANAKVYTWDWSSTTSPGDTVYLCGTIQGTGSANSSGIVVRESGTSAVLPITIKFCKSGEADCGTSVGKLSNPAWASAISSTGKNYIVIDGNGGTIENTANGTVLANQQKSYGVHINKGTNIVIKNLVIDNMYVHEYNVNDSARYDTAGIYLYDTHAGENYEISNNTISDADNGIKVGLYYETYSNILIHHNTISRCNWGIGFAGALSGTVIKNTKMYNNEITIGANWTEPDFPDRYHHNGVFIYSSDTNIAVLENFEFYNNYVHGPLTDPGFLWSSSSGIQVKSWSVTSSGYKFYNNLFVAGPYVSESSGMANGYILITYGDRSPKVYNNTFVGNTSYGVMYAVYTGDGVLTAKNNIFLGVGEGNFRPLYNIYAYPGSTGSANILADNNSYYNYRNIGRLGATSGATIEAWRTLLGGCPGTDNECSGIDTDPGINASTYKPDAAGDDVVGAGTATGQLSSSDKDGNSWATPPSIGAYEYGSSADTTAPILSEVTPVTASSSNQAPSYVFSSDEAGTVTYGGDCGNGSLSTAIVGNNTTSWALGIATYSDCTITVTDAASNASTPLAVQEFVITPVDSAAAKTIEGGVVFTTLP